MSIIISKNGKNAVRVEKSSFDKEDFLQQYIYENPESIPLYDIKEDIRLLILAREFQTSSGRIDALGIDKDGEIYIVETKLFKNPDKRTVIAQSLDYGAALWKHSGDFAQFISALDGAVYETFGVPLASKLRDFFGLSEEEAAALLESVRQNLSEGAFRFVVLMDKLNSALKDLVIYVNQNSKFDVYAVEFEYYKHKEQEIIIPKIFGAEVKKEVAVRTGATKEWGESGFFEDAKQYLEESEMQAVETLYRSFKSHFQIRFGTGATRASFTVQIPYKDGTLSLLEITAKGMIRFYLSGLAKRNVPESQIRALVDNLESVHPSFAVEGDLAHSYSSTHVNDIANEKVLERLQQAVLDFASLIQGPVK